MGLLNDEDLKNVNGGAGISTNTNKTGDVNENGEVYFKFPIITSLSGWYSQESLEKLCSDNIAYASIIKPYVTADVRAAVTKLYGSNVPASVKEMLG